MEPSNKNYTDSGDCRAVADVLVRIGDKWTVYIVKLLSHGTMRFNEMRREVPAISQRMLSLTLRGLERDGLVKRTVTSSIPPRVDYELTAKGLTLIDPLRAIGQWAITNRDYVESARITYDIAHAGSKTVESLSKKGQATAQNFAKSKPSPAAQAEN